MGDHFFHATSLTFTAKIIIIMIIKTAEESYIRTNLEWTVFPVSHSDVDLFADSREGFL